MANHGSRTAAWGASCLAIALAATGCPTVDLGDTPEDIGRCNPPGGLAYFQDVIWPSYVQASQPACTMTGACHLLGGGNLLGYKIDDLGTPNPRPDHPANFRATLIHLDCGTPMTSKFLTKPLGGIEGHGGMDIFQPGAPQVQLFLDWFQ
jgi:hypothetical protein